MDAIFKIPSSEFNEELFKKIILLLNGRNAEITIAVHENDTLDNLESNKDFWSRLDKSIRDIDDGKGVNFTMSDLERFVKN